MQKQKKNTTLLCTFRNCKNIQTDNEFCAKHQAKKGRKDLIKAIETLEELATDACQGSSDVELEVNKAYNLLMDFIIYS